MSTCNSWCQSTLLKNDKSFNAELRPSTMLGAGSIGPLVGRSYRRVTQGKSKSGETTVAGILPRLYLTGMKGMKGMGTDYKNRPLRC